MESKPTLERFILDNFDTTLHEIYEAMSSSTTIVYKDEMVCLMTDDFIYYFGAAEKHRKTRKFYRFYKDFNLKDKEFVSKDTNMYKSLVKNGIIKQI